MKMIAKSGGTARQKCKRDHRRFFLLQAIATDLGARRKIEYRLAVQKAGAVRQRVGRTGGDAESKRLGQRSPRSQAQRNAAVSESPEPTALTTRTGGGTACHDPCGARQNGSLRAGRHQGAF